MLLFYYCYYYYYGTGCYDSWLWVFYLLLLLLLLLYSLHSRTIQKGNMAIVYMSEWSCWQSNTKNWCSCWVYKRRMSRKGQKEYMYKRKQNLTREMYNFFLRPIEEKGEIMCLIRLRDLYRPCSKWCCNDLISWGWSWQHAIPKSLHDSELSIGAPFKSYWLERDNWDNDKHKAAYFLVLSGKFQLLHHWSRLLRSSWSRDASATDLIDFTSLESSADK